MVQAYVDGAIDYKAYDGSRRWWTSTMMVIRALEKRQKLKVLELSAHRAIGVQAMLDLNQTTEYRQQYAMDYIGRYEAEAMPWFGPPKSQNSLSSDPLDAIARWYLMFGSDPELVRQMENG